MEIKCTKCQETLPYMVGFEKIWWIEPHRCKVDSTSANAQIADDMEQFHSDENGIIKVMKSDFVRWIRQIRALELRNA